MENLGRQAMIDSCPELYAGLGLLMLHKNALYFDADVVRKVGNNNAAAFKNEMMICATLQQASAASDFMPTIYDVTDDGITMERIEGETLRIGYDPSGSVLSHDDKKLAQQLFVLTEQLTGILGGDGVLVHGDYAPNNILRTNSGLVVIDFENSCVSDEKDRYKNISQLLTRLWYNRPLLHQLWALQNDCSSDPEAFRSTFQKQVIKKLKRGVGHYPDSVADSVGLAYIERVMRRNLLEIGWN